jgi:chromosomal replication initiator protein
MESVQGGAMTDFRHRFRDVDVLVVDDIHFLAKLDRTQEEFFHTFNTLHQAGKQIVLSSDAAPEEIPLLEERLVSRFKWGLVCKLDAPCYETRVAILKTKAKLRGLLLPDDCAAYMAERIATNIRELEGAIVKCQIQSSVEERPITLDLVRSALGEPAAQAQGELSIQSIINIVTEHYRVKPAELLSKRRQRSVALPRQVCMFLARKHTRLSLEEIGLNFGGRDHTTVMHAIKTIESRSEGDGDFDAVLKVLEDRLKVGRA